MFQFTDAIVRKAERVASRGSSVDAIRVLRRLSLADFGELFWNLPAPALPNLSAVLPRMADVATQNSFTGTNGHSLLTQSLAFISSIRTTYAEHFGRKLQDIDLLDFGCGYGRLIRLMYYFTDPSRIWGLDPWEEALNLCRADGVMANFGRSEYHPVTLPVADRQFDLIYAFSVFTHTSERATKTGLKALGRHANPGSLCFITIRPQEYWAANKEYETQLEELTSEHRANAFAFRPHNLPPIDGDIPFGDTSMEVAWLRAAAEPDWEIFGLDRSQDDPYQLIIILKRTV